MSKIALICGITGQDGSYLAEYLISKNYIVHGIIRRSSTFNTERIDHIFNKLILHYGDVTDPLVISNLVSKIKPDELYNLSAQSHVKVSFEEPYYTGQVDAIGTLNILESVKNHAPNCRVYQASTSELYGGVIENMPDKGYNENSVMHPKSPYGVAKLYGLWICKNYRESYGLHISNGILFNHESERRGETFVTRKITKALTKIKRKIDENIVIGRPISTFLPEPLVLGNIYAKRDWGYAPDYVDAMWRILQENEGDDYVISTGETHTVKEFIELSCGELGLNISWIGKDQDERGVINIDGEEITIVKIDPKYYRPSEVDILLGDYSKAKNILGWEPMVKFKELVKIMINHDLKNF
jgi:GDPmannose 4,6-dehydratase